MMQCRVEMSRGSPPVCQLDVNWMSTGCQLDVNWIPCGMHDDHASAADSNNVVKFAVTSGRD